MIRSMTGFGVAAVAKGGISARVEVRSVNHRYLQVKARLPSDLGTLEPGLEAIVRESLDRGSVSISASVEREAEARTARVNADVARYYQKTLAALSKDLGLRDGLSVETLVGLPGVLGSGDDDRERRREDELVLDAAKKAVAALVQMRGKEGKSLLADLRKNAKGVAVLVGTIGKRMPVVVREHHENLKKRVEELLGGRQPVRPEDLSRELALIADRMDVGEELTRLSSHLDQWESLLGKGGAVGRQLDFLVQELLREANTIGSKCNDAAVAHAVVELKTLIERLREQVQNVE
ncbi:MAG TPA: YicC/YloC family endoribonuclease [Planctomycetota bacterium]|nr:YicC/YloC family endoribonuclease [Planctomycetota bacterium]